MQLNTKANYKKTLKAGVEFYNEMIGEQGYIDPKINAIALENRIIGWIVAQEWFERFCFNLKAKYPRDGGIVHAQNMALEVTSDITKGSLRFKME